MGYVLLVITAYFLVTIIKFRSFGVLVFIPMVISTIFVVALFINIVDSMP